MFSTLRNLLGRLTQRELKVILGLLLIGGGTWAFVEIADEVMERETQQLDERILLSLRRTDDSAVPIGPEWLGEVARDITALGGITVLTLVTLAVGGFLAIRRNFGAMWFLVVAVAGGQLLSAVLKWSFDRPRPQVVPHLAGVYSQSFPSGHSMLSAVVYLTLGTLLVRLVEERSLKAYLLAIAAMITFLVGVSRVYVGVHYPTDVLGGWAAGVVWATLVWLVARYLQRRGKVEQSIDRK